MDGEASDGERHRSGQRRASRWNQTGAMSLGKVGRIKRRETAQERDALRAVGDDTIERKIDRGSGFPDDVQRDGIAGLGGGEDNRREATEISRGSRSGKFNHRAG